MDGRVERLKWGRFRMIAGESRRNVAQADPQHAARTLELFISVLGHDLRDPLAAVMAAAGVLLQRGGLTDLQRRNVLRIKASSERMGRMISDVLDFARSRSGTMVLYPAPANLHEICRQVVDEVRTAHPEREVRLDLQGDPRGVWDADRLAQVVSNLLSNAESYSPQGSPIVLESWGDAQSSHLSITNQGPVIPENRVAALFDPFNRGDFLERRANVHGLGLGLFIVRAIVDAHRGTIDVRSSHEEGTTFKVQLPRGWSEGSERLWEVVPGPARD